MKNALPALAFSTALLLLVPACHKNTGEAPGPADAATGTSGQALGTDAGGTTAAGGTAVDAGSTTGTDTTLGTGAGAAPAVDAGTASAGGAKASAASAQSREACLDQWLKAQRLDTYGHPEGTMYAGGSPLFNERTGQSQDRFEYVARRHPAMRTACGGGVADAGTR